VTSGGVKLHYVESGDEEKPLMVFVHGFPEFWYSWRYQIKHFQKNYHVVALDMRGYNDSDKPSGVENYSLHLLVNDIKVLVESLGSGKLTLVSHDWGGLVAWAFAASYPDMLQNLVTCNSPHPIAIGDARKEGWDRIFKSWYVIFFQCPILPELNCMSEDMGFFNQILGDAGLHKDEELLEAFKYAFRDFKTWNRTINYYRSLMKNQEKNKSEFGELYKNIKVRTLAIFGTGDKYSSVKTAKYSAKYVEDFQLELLDGVSHWVQQEAPEKVNALIDQFIQQ
jgi:pimeloyl-ACP methyl ester carboxylesterase